MSCDRFRSASSRACGDGASNSVQLEGRYYYAQSGADVGPAFQQLQNQIIRLTK